MTMGRMQEGFSSRAAARDVAGWGRGLDPGGRLGASGFGLGRNNWRPWTRDADGLGAWDSRECAGLGESGRRGFLRSGCGGIVGDFVDHLALVDIEVDAWRIFHGDVKSAQNEVGAAEVDG